MNAPRPAPDRIVEIALGRVEAGDASGDDRASAIDAREERRGQAGAGRRHAASSRLENGVAFGMLHPDESSIAGMALLEIANVCRKGVAGHDFRTVAGDKDRADFADPVWAQRSGKKSRLNLGAWRRALAVHVDLESSCNVRCGPAAFHSALARAPYREPSPIGPDTANRSFCPSHKPGAERTEDKARKIDLTRRRPLAYGMPHMAQVRIRVTMSARQRRRGAGGSNRMSFRARRRMEVSMKRRPQTARTIVRALRVEAPE